MIATLTSSRLREWTGVRTNYLPALSLPFARVPPVLLDCPALSACLAAFFCFFVRDPSGGAAALVDEPELSGCCLTFSLSVDMC